ncbi:cyclase family protein [Rhodoplanes sp. TEM]|uniref:Cyclase family protein n=1 Tax=Rhodoplanes tepidamans TaxID=200616 RepID=A0ABT5JJR1_RHOTP|nr:MULTISPECIES: cyclase family protein [Rhodoplanes]MDC7789544.1 cyclase family protein [Rhodoplanes tepidamans]MDC7986719.1 cyclase family protein [Rhodoplanes sp. TEM]MDQ0359167.1 kynurenine formamidase [Rhodoplanes tepidamans]
MCVPGCMEAVRAGLSRRGFFGRAGAAAAGFAATAVTPVPAPAATLAPRSFERMIDLTHTLGPQFPTFFDTPGIEFETRAEYAKDGYNMYVWKLLEHAGTHIDAPIHFAAKGASVDQIAADTLVVPLAVVDVVERADNDPDYLLSRDDLVAWEAKHGRLPRGCCVAMHAGFGRIAVSDPARFIGRDVDGTLHFPGIAPEAAAWLLNDREVAGLAVDTLSLDNGPSTEFGTHKLWLTAGRWGLENVANLDQAPPTGATLVVGVPKVKDATGAPVRLFAFV